MTEDPRRDIIAVIVALVILGIIGALL